MTRIVLDRLEKSYAPRGTPVLAGLSLQVQPGELLALLGPSGSGKSTLLKLIAGIEHPDAGDIRFDDRSLRDVSPDRRGAVLMFQDAYLFPFMNVAANIGFGLQVRRLSSREIKAAVADMLDLVELPGIERKYPGQLSGGQQQRVALARALVVKPRVLLLDEPLASLDTEIRHTLQAVIRRIQRELRITTLLVTHDLGEVLAMSDRTAILLDGRIEACDQPERLFERPPTRASARFMGVSTFLEGRVEGEHFHSALGSLQITSAPGCPRHTTLAIRPEQTRLIDDAAPNSVAGIVENLVYRGEFTDYDVRVGETLVRVKAPQGDRGHHVGGHVYVHFPAAKLFEVT